MLKKSVAQPAGIRGELLAVLYLIAAAAPLLAAWAAGIEPESPWFEIGAGLAVISASMFYLQFWSLGRFETLSGRGGIDRTMGFHRVAALAALLTAIVHPLAPLVPVFLENLGVRRLGQAAALPSSRDDRSSARPSRAFCLALINAAVGS